MKNSNRNHNNLPPKMNNNIKKKGYFKIKELFGGDTKLCILNIITIFGFCLYAYGIYLHVVIRGKVWGNMAIDLLIKILGPLPGVITIVVIGSVILLFCLYIALFRAVNVFLCWFWIFSLYQCAINSFLDFLGLPNEPINQFFKVMFPTLWYPVKEICFVVLSIILTIIWLKKISRKEITKIDIILIIILSAGLILATLESQLVLINNILIVYS